MSLLDAKTLADTYKYGLNTIAPGSATVTQYPGGYVVRPGKEQAAFLTRLIERKISSSPAKPGQPAPTAQESVKLDLSAVYMPIILKRAIPIGLGVLFVGFMLGRMTK